MFSDKRMSLVRRAIAATLLAGAAVGVAQAQTMIVQSTGPSASSYPAGKKLPDGTKIELKANDRVTVLDASGTRVLTGPKTYNLGANAAEGPAGNKIAGFLRYDGRKRTGAVRGGTPSAGAAAFEVADSPDRPSPNLWFVDTSKPGKYCIVKAEQVGVWRAMTDAENSSMLRAVDGSATGELYWQPGAEMVLWPKDDVPIQDGASYSITSEAGQAVTITFHFIEQPINNRSTAEEVAAALIENDCQIQLNTMVSTLATLPPDDAFGGGEGDR